MFALISVECFTIFLPFRAQSYCFFSRNVQLLVEKNG